MITDFYEAKEKKNLRMNKIAWVWKATRSLLQPHHDRLPINDHPASGQITTPSTTPTTPATRKRQATFLGHVIRRGKLEHLVTTGKFEGKRSRGRQREKIMDGLATWLGTGKVSDILAAVKDRDLWRNMIANAYKQGT
ncbi:hypothetical protein PoB_004991500 [Plakobranchus ocellatus]|uniref:Uncharacterized protein n=1 Tax=Plakobranchus ocellatus TaxID=259542 RepID=A0AAV4BSH5_9GAST|nr:hypothetical protein PoB_004991500 [Plakobranchus ocellatus]